METRRFRKPKIKTPPPVKSAITRKPPAQVDKDEKMKASLEEAFFSLYSFGGRKFQKNTSHPQNDPDNSGDFKSHKLWKVIGHEVLALNEAYTQRTVSFSHDKNPIHAKHAGYQFYFLPRNLFRVRHVFASLPWMEGSLSSLLGHWMRANSEAEVFNLLDLGCGTGAFSLGFLEWIVSRKKQGENLPPIKLVLVDQGKNLMQIAVENIRTYARKALPDLPIEIELVSDGVEAFLGREGEKYQLVGTAMALNEMNILASGRKKGKAERIVIPIRKKIKPGGVFIAVEPGTRKGYMNLMAMRDLMKEQTILFPCPHQKPCPLWDNRVSRWCHTTKEIPPNFFFDKELKQTGKIPLEMREINLAGLAFQATTSTEPPFQKEETGRILSKALPKRESGKKETNTDETKTKSKTFRGKDKTDQKAKVMLVCTQEGKLEERAVPEGYLPRRGDKTPTKK